jgi:UDP-GlcNAc:undecaprenyl-phosphate GlcNAc-1-phosphate transferase
MGDTGSMFLGFACATMIVLLAQEQPKWFLASMVMFALPVMDTTLAFARRWVNGRPIFSADKFHFHHQLIARGLSVKKTVLISYGLAIGFTLLGAAIVVTRTRYAVAIYLVTFASIIVAAYKMGMVHERPRRGMPVTLKDSDPETALASISPDDVFEIPQDGMESQISNGENAEETAHRKTMAQAPVPPAF